MAGKIFDVIGIGLSCVDLVMKVPKFPEVDEVVVTLEYGKHFGGVAANAIVALARLGAKVGFIGKIGADSFGDDILNEFKKVGVDTRGVIRDKDFGSPLSFIQVDNQGDRKISHYPGPAPFMSPQDVEPLRDYIASAKIIHLDGINPHSAIRSAEIAKEEGTLVSFDLSTSLEAVEIFGLTREDVINFVKPMDVFIPCKLAAKGLTGEDNFEEAAKKLLEIGPSTVAITLGGGGCVAANRKEVVKKPAYMVEVKDTTGAGDAFHGGFLYGLLHDWSLDKTAQFANAVAAIKCQYFGARSGLPTEREVEKFLKTAEPL
ncbi:MAG: carbohydrate kinase family protein [Candidatus Jordarchaeum sp.]|uniref:carbohydrate kinase family protein n=1 Tax=Candidatus Jordarchaeum sp. TaxID=2823881 RepID=UPI00404B0E5A